MPRTHALLPVGALVTGAAVWGTMWYPYRLLHEQGVGGILATVVTYAVALALGAIFLWSDFRRLRPTPILIAIGLASAACNLGYVLSTLYGEVMRVLLLFYLAPFWTVLLARAFLGERLTGAGYGVILLSLIGAATMLWHPALGAPWPRSSAEWIGMAAGFFFALSNVLIRRADHLPIASKTLAVFVGAIVLGGVLLAFGIETYPAQVAAPSIAWILGIGAVLVAVNLVVQFGLMRTPANRAIVILLSELVFAAISSWWLAGESLGLQEWIGGALIASASLCSAAMENS